MASELLPCPFCDGEAGLEQVAGEMPRFYPIVKCKVCRNRGLPANTEAEAIAAWNQRPPAQPSGDMVEADSGFTPENLADAEWLWTNLPVGPVKFHDRPTHERALICHTVARFRQHVLAAIQPHMRAAFVEGARAMQEAAAQEIERDHCVTGKHGLHISQFKSLGEWLTACRAANIRAIDATKLENPHG